MVGIIYLVQPCELIRTNRYKIGMSKKNTIEKVKNGYKKGSRIIFIFEVDNPKFMESRLKISFNKKFNLIAGNEYFEGNEEKIKNTFLSIVLSNNRKEDIGVMEIQKENRIIKIQKWWKKYYFEFVYSDIHDKFPNLYQNKYRNKIIVKIDYISISDLNGESEITFTQFWNNYTKRAMEQYEMDTDTFIMRDDDFKYLKKIVDKKIIEKGKFYDFSNKVFLKKLVKYKFKRNIISEFNIINHKENRLIVQHYLCASCILNNKYFCSIDNESKYFIFSDKIYSSNIRTPKYIKFITLNRINFDQQYIRKYVPYYIDSCCLLNRNYKIIEELDNNKINKDYLKIESNGYLFNDKTSPLQGNKDNIKSYIIKINKLIYNYKNLNENSAKILSNMYNYINI